MDLDGDVDAVISGYRADLSERVRGADEIVLGGERAGTCEEGSPLGPGV